MYEYFKYLINDHNKEEQISGGPLTYQGQPNAVLFVYLFHLSSTTSSLLISLNCYEIIDNLVTSR